MIRQLWTRLRYWFLKQIRGECPDCKVLLVEEKGYARSYCPKCLGKFHHL